MSRFFRNTIRFVATEDIPCHPSQKAKGKTKIWRAISLLVAIPAVVILSIYNHILAREGEYQRPPFVTYEYLRIRNKRYPWGDGTKTLFHNPERNPLPDGYEDQEEEAEAEEEGEE